MSECYYLVKINGERRAVSGPLAQRETSLNEFTHLRKINTDPPTYLLEVNGHDLRLKYDEFYNYRKFASRVEQILDLVLPSMKKESWAEVRKLLHDSQQEIEASTEAAGMPFQKGASK